MNPRTPDLLDRRSQALKKEISSALREDPQLLSVAIENIERWRDKDGKWGRHTPYMESWLEIIDEGVEACCRILEDTSEKTQALRQAAPFAGVIPDKKRLEFLAQWEANHEAK